MATNALTDTFRAYLEGCSAAMAGQIIGVLLQAGHAASSEAPGTTAVGSAVTKTGKKKRKLTKSNVAAVGPKRPLNCFLAFRIYYGGIFAPFTQKAISKTLNVLWNADLLNAKWTALAKAYSIVREGREKNEVPPDKFFAICAPLIGVIPPGEYLQKMGWQVALPPEGEKEKMPQITRLFAPSLDDFPKEIATTTLSVDDLVNHCYAVGLVNAGNDGAPKMSTQGSLIMVSKPTAVIADECPRPVFPSELANSQSSPTNNVDPSPLMLAPAAGQVALEQAVNVLAESGGGVPYSPIFDPANHFDFSFNPAAPNTAVEDDGVWDAFDPNTVMGQNEEGDMDVSLDEMLTVDFGDFINDDGMF